MSDLADAPPSPGTSYRYRVVSKRAEGRAKVATFATLAAARKRMTLLLSHEPWTALGNKATDLVCCEGFMCSCGGKTFEEDTAERREKMPALLWVRLERREVSPWVDIETLKP